MPSKGEGNRLETDSFARRDTRRMGLLSALLSFGAVLFFSCGIPQTIYLDPPDFSGNGASQVVITHNINNYSSVEGASQSFRGYEIYYRAFDSQSAADSSLASLQAKVSSDPNNPESVLYYAKSGLGYRSMKAAGDATAPLIKITDPSKSAVYYLNMPDSGDEWNISKDPAILFDVERDIADSARSSFVVLANWQAGDEDYSGTADNPATKYFVLFAVAYGQDPETIGQTLHSMPSTLTSADCIIQF